MTKHFCDLCGAELKAPAPRARKAQYELVQLGGIAAQNPAFQTGKLTVDIGFTGEYCEVCQEKIVGGMQLDFVLARGLSKKLGS